MGILPSTKLQCIVGVSIHRASDISNVWTSPARVDLNTESVDRVQVDPA